MKSGQYVLSCAVAALAGTVANPPAFAQALKETGAESPTQLQDIIVTARRREESLQTAPVSVSAVSAAKLDMLNVITVDRISQLIPNVSIVPASGNLGGNTAFIRGIGTQEPLLTVDSGVGQYVDGVYMGRQSGNNVELVALRRIEVERGPQGTLFGRNTTGGAINLVTREASSTFHIEEKAGYASYDDWYSRSTVDTGDLGTSGLKAIIAFKHHERNGYANNPGQPDDRDPGALLSNSVWGKLSGRWGALSMDLTADYGHQKGQREPFQISYAYPVSQGSFVIPYYAQSVSLGGQPFIASRSRLHDIPLSFVGDQTNRTAGTALTLSYELDPALTLKSISSLRSWRASAPTNQGPDARGPVFDLSSPDFYTIQPVNPFFAPQALRQRQVSQELQLLGHSGAWNYVAGLYYFEEHVREHSPNYFTIVVPNAAFGPLAAAFDAQSIPYLGVNYGQDLSYQGKSASYAAFGQISYRPPSLDDKFEITGGLRYTHDKKSIDQYSVPVASPIPGPSLVDPGLVEGPSRSDRVGFHNLSYLASVKYQWTIDIMTYGRVASGYKSGGFDARAQPGVQFVYKPEKATSYEVGTKAEFLDRHLRTNASLFYTKYKSLQVAQYAGGNGFTPNADAHYQGFELEADLIVTSKLSVDGNVGYVDAVYDRFLLKDPASGIVSDYKDAAKFPYVPKWTTHVGAQYELPSIGVGKLLARVDFSHTSERVFAATTLLNPARDIIRDPGQDLLSARLILTDVTIGRATLEASVWGENLLKDDRVDAGIDFGPSIGIAGVSYGQPRTFGLDVTVRY